MPDLQKNYRLSTLAVHGGYTPDGAEHCMTPPIYQTNAYAFESVEYAKNVFELSVPGNIYTRITNPTVAVLEERVRLLEGGVGAVATASGHAAIFNAVLNLAGSGDEIVSSLRIYGGAINLLGVTLAGLGIKTHFVDPDDLDAWERAINDKTRALFVEVIGNPNANVADIGRIAQIAHRYGVPLIVDSTLSTPCSIRPFEHGADIVVHSATKYLSGQGNAMAGVVVDGGKFRYAGNPRFPRYNEPDASYHGMNFGTDCGDAGYITRLRALLLRDVGACLSPFSAFLILSGLETLPLRMKQHCSNALAAAKFLEANPAVATVNYPGLPGNPYYGLVQKYLKGCGGACFTFELRGGKAAGVRFIESLRLLRNVANLGDARSMVSHPASTTHSQLSEEQLADSGITGGTIRLSIGIEDESDILEDLEQAIRAARP